MINNGLKNCLNRLSSYLKNSPSLSSPVIFPLKRLRKRTGFPLKQPCYLPFLQPPSAPEESAANGLAVIRDLVKRRLAKLEPEVDVLRYLHLVSDKACSRG